MIPAPTSTGNSSTAAPSRKKGGLRSLLDRERDLDDITWEKISSLENFHYFDITAVLAYVAKLHIVDRWLALDEEKGRELFHKLVQEVKGTFKGVNYTEK